MFEQEKVIMHLNKHKKISIITPLYKGTKYLPDLSKMIEACAKKASDIAEVEWVISNDDPKDPLEDSVLVEGVNVKIINTDINRGIQGARVTGLNASQGEYVLFLDQDDYIAPEWIESQLEHIGDADAVVCSATRDGEKFYDTKVRPSLEVCITKEYNISDNWGFIPGQVLLRKDSIPGLWKNRWLKWNCCDDYFLWLLMFAKGCRFEINPDVLYDHRSTGTNQSSNSFEWYKSTLEMIELLKDNKVLGNVEIEKFTEARQKLFDESFMDKAWCNSKLDILNRILQLYERDIKIGSKLHSLFGSDIKIAIYGAAIGKHVYERLIREGINVECFIDQNADNLVLPIPAYVRETIPKDIDLVINTLIRYEEETKEYVEELYPGVSVIHIKELLSLVL